MVKREPIPFTSRQGRAEWILSLLWIPIHVFGLPSLLVLLFPQITESTLNLACYAIGAVFLLLTQFRFLRRDFDPLCDRPVRVLLEVLIAYGAMLLFNMAVSGLLLAVMDTVENPNNAAVVEMAQVDSGPIAALAVFLAPLVEELMFRAGIFGALRHKNRLLAYLVVMILFPVYHILGYALNDPMTWVYVLQYIPVSYLLCRVYERTNTIWASIAFHMLVNFIALNALTTLEKLL